MCVAMRAVLAYMLLRHTMLENCASVCGLEALVEVF
jgi:hypothetical protein